MSLALLAPAALSLSLAEGIGRAVTQDERAGQVQFVARQSEVDLQGSFRRFTSDIAWDPAHPQQGHVRVDIDLASTDAGGGDADHLLQSAEFFDVARYPLATFESRSLRATDADHFLAEGILTLKGNRAKIAVPFTSRRDSTGTWFEGGTTISRLAFHVGEGSWSDTGTLEDGVLIRFRLRAEP